VRPLTYRTRLACGAVALALLLAASPARAEGIINDLKAKIFDARMALKTFVGGLRHCAELNGTNFYFQPRDRVLDLEEYHQSLDNLVKSQAFNPEKRQPWNEADANARWEQVKKQAARDNEVCKLVAKLPELEKKLQEVEHKDDEPKKNESKQSESKKSE
jgi:tRNA nucleotidyltransferase/poly(A) polymerase